MSIRIKTILVLILVAGIYLGFVFGVLRLSVQPSFNALERESAERDMERCVEAIEREIYHLNRFTDDYARWDDTWHFALDGNEEYVESNFILDTFVENSLGLICVTNTEGEIVWAGTLDEESEEIVRTDEMPRVLRDHPSLLEHDSVDSGLCGILITEGGTTLISSRPIRTSANEGPIHGTLVMTRPLGEEILSALAEQTRVPFQLIPVSEVERSHEDPEDGSVVVRDLNEESLSVCSTLRDPWGDPVLHISADIPRLIAAHGRRTLRVTFMLALAGGLVVPLLTLWLLEPMILARLSRLSRDVRRIGTRADLSVRVSEQGSDEIGRLGSEINRMLRALELAEETLRQMSRAIESTADAVVVTDREGRITSVNPAFTAITGYTAEQAFGQTPRLLKSGEVPPEVYEDMWSTITRGEGWRGDVTNRRSDDSLYHAALTISPIVSDSGSIDGFVGLQRDVTAERLAEAALMEAKVAAEQANRELQETNAHLHEATALASAMAAKAEMAVVAKSEFLATMSHEIRTPMNGIIGMTELLLDTELTGTQLDFADTIRSCAESLLSLINDILDYSKIEAGRLDLEQIDFDLRTTIEGILDVVAQRAQSKGLELVCLIHPNVPRRVSGDPGRLRQVILNLLNNAIKFTDEGEVTVHVTLESETEDTHTLRIRVADTGIGIPRDRQEIIFESFSQADASTTRRFGGTGLGLAICKQIIGVMGGEIGVESEENRGSTFWFTVPLAKCTTPEEITPSDIDLLGRRILVVDDNRTNLALFSALLGSWGCRHTEAESGERALALLREAVEEKDPYHILLLDRQMPGMDGETLGRAVKSDSLISDTILVMLTSLAERGDASRLHEIGFAAYLPKPVKQSHLHDCLVTVLGQRVCARGPAAPPLVTRHTLREARRRAHILLAEDNPVNQRVAIHMLTRMGYLVDAVPNGREAVEALEHGRFDIVLMDCHMPEMDGYEATRRIREQENGLSHTPIIAMTANAMKGDRERCLEAGMDDYLSKPVKSEDLADIIERWLSPADRP
ncbi:response regulator [Candidatus Sumerlaeota bacterium]|nr:response regulator [Candidatus Sumerlaeota bacterium]